MLEVCSGDIHLTSLHGRAKRMPHSGYGRKSLTFASRNEQIEGLRLAPRNPVLGCCSGRGFWSRRGLYSESLKLDAERPHGPVPILAKPRACSDSLCLGSFRSDRRLRGSNHRDHRPLHTQGKPRGRAYILRSDAAWRTTSSISVSPRLKANPSPT